MRLALIVGILICMLESTCTFGLSAHVMIDLLRGLENKGHCVFTDNFYTSPTLGHYLTTIRTCLCGTIRPNRRGFPKDLVKSNSEARKLPRGYFDWRQCDDMIATCWKDKKVVYFLSTCHVPKKENLTVKRHNKWDRRRVSRHTIRGSIFEIQGSCESQ